ncbi:unnamed protein product, partial [marine sediment metagenome]
ENSTFNIKGNIRGSCGKYAENSTFKTSNKETYEKIKKDIGFFERLIDRNKVKLIK